MGKLPEMRVFRYQAELDGYLLLGDGGGHLSPTTTMPSWMLASAPDRRASNRQALPKRNPNHPDLNHSGNSN
jgi:hypothetical protein